MNIGVDFDNTIARYDTSFREVALKEGIVDKNWKGKGKTELRDHLRRLPNGEKTWMKLQGRVYGKYMHHAEMLPGVANFLMNCKRRNHNLFIVSHKTKYGHFDPERISLRQEALKWMEAKRFFDQNFFGVERKNVFFADTRVEKVNKIEQLKCDWFIDDLPEVFAEKSFPLITKKVLFGKFDGNKIDSDIFQMDSWIDISNLVLGHTTDEDIIFWANKLVGPLIDKIEKISGRGNSRIYKILMNDKKSYALKHYPDRLSDIRPRLRTEFHAFSLLHQKNITNVPKAVEKDENLNIGIYEWIAGEPVTDPTLSDLEQVTNFVKKLHLLSQIIIKSDLSPASEACLSAADLLCQIEKRLSRLKLLSENFPELSAFLEQRFEPLWTAVKDESYYLWPVESRDSNLNRLKQTLSPSDLGFHNTIRQGDGKIIFIDFDYFGWDDPVKLTADFIWHPAMDLNAIISRAWRSNMLNLFYTHQDFQKRLIAAMPLYGLRWALIVLNEFLPGFAEQRKKAGAINTYDIRKSREIQIGKAKHYCDLVEKLNSPKSFV